MMTNFIFLTFSENELYTDMYSVYFSTEIPSNV